MTGTIASASGSYTAVAAGDHVSWTLQYDPATRASSSTDYGYNYVAKGPVLTNIVDQTKNIPLYTASASGMDSELTLRSFSMMGSNFTASDILRVAGVAEPWNMVYATQLFLGPGQALSSVDLSKFHPDQAGFIAGSGGGSSSELVYYDAPLSNSSSHSYRLLFTADVDSIKVASTPEPGSLALFILGAAGFTTRFLRSPFRRRR